METSKTLLLFSSIWGAVALMTLFIRPPIPWYAFFITSINLSFFYFMRARKEGNDGKNYSMW